MSGVIIDYFINARPVGYISHATFITLIKVKLARDIKTSIMVAANIRDII